MRIKWFDRTIANCCLMHSQGAVNLTRMEYMSQPIGDGSVEPSDSEGNDSDPGILVIDLDQPVTPPNLLDDATIPGADLYADPFEPESKLEDQVITHTRAYSPKISPTKDSLGILRARSNSRENTSRPESDRPISDRSIVNGPSKLDQAIKETSNQSFEFSNELAFSSSSKCPLPQGLRTGVAEFRNICTERDVHLVLPGCSQLGEKYISTMSYSGLFAQVFFPDSVFQTLPKDPLLWSKVHFEAVLHLGILTGFKFVFKCSEEDVLVSVSVKCPDTVETVSRLITENEPFVLAPTSLRKLNEQCVERTAMPLILFGKHTKANLLLNVDITHWGLSFRKLFSYIHYSSGNISEQERSMIRRDLVVVLRDLGRNTRLSYGKELRIFYHSKGLVTYYRQKLFQEVKKIKPQNKKKEKVEVPEFPMDVSFKLDGEECLVKCPICELRFERGSETYFSHLGRYHFNPYCEPRTCQQPNCGYNIEDGVDHFRHVHSHSNSTISFESYGNIRFEKVEKSTYPKTGTAFACWNPCPICLKNIATDNELRIHFVIIHCLSEILLHIPRKQGPADTHLCPRIGCLEIFSDVWQLAMHLGIKHDLIRSWLKPTPWKDAIRCPLKNCSDRSISGDWSKAQSHLSQHAIGFVIEEIAKLQRTFGKDDGQCPMVGCCIETEDIIQHFHLEHGASLWWLSSLPMKKFDDPELLRHWQEKLSQNNPIYVCPVCVRSLHSVKCFGHKTALLDHLLNAHYRKQLEAKCNGFPNTVDSFWCSSCNTRIVRTSWLEHHALFHGEVIGCIPLDVYGELGKDIELVVFNMELSAPSSSVPTPLEVIIADLHRRASKQTNPKLPDLILPTNYPPKTRDSSSMKKYQTKLTPKSGLESRETISRTLSLSSIQSTQGVLAQRLLPEAVQNSAAFALEELQRGGKLPRLMEFPFPDSHTASSRVDYFRSSGFTFPKSSLPLSISAQPQPGPIVLSNGALPSTTIVPPSSFQVAIPLGWPLVPLSREYNQLMAIKAKFAKHDSVMVACLKCEAGFKDLESLLDHIEKNANHNEDVPGVCCHCEMMFSLGPQGTTASFFKLHAYSKIHLHNRWIISVKQSMRGAMKCDLHLRSVSMSVLNRCDICLEEVSQLDTHLRCPSHRQKVQFVTIFEEYCNAKITCPVTCSIQDVKYFLSLVHLQIILISISFQQAPQILSRIHDLINEKELQHCEDVNQYVQNLEARTRKFKFVCLACFSLTQNAQSLVQHSQTFLHKRNHPDSEILNSGPIFQCLVCQSQFKNIADLKLHLYTKTHLNKESQGQHSSMQNFVNPTLSVDDYCPLCQTEGVLQGHLLSPSHVAKEKHANEYIQWCHNWKHNPVTCSKESLKIYREHWFRTASSDSNFIDALSVIKHIHAPIWGHCVSKLFTVSNVNHQSEDDGVESASHTSCGTTGALTQPYDLSTRRIRGADLQNSNCASFQSGWVMPSLLLNPSYIGEERHANDYLQWCYTSQQNPRTCSKEVLRIYRDHWFWTAFPGSNFADAVNVIKRIHEPILGHCVSKLLIPSEEERAENTSHVQCGTAGILAELRDLSTGKNNGAASSKTYRETCGNLRPRPSQYSTNVGDLRVPLHPLSNGSFAPDKTHKTDRALWSRPPEESQHSKRNSSNRTHGSDQTYPMMRNPWLHLVEEGMCQPSSGANSKVMCIKADSAARLSIDPQMESSPKRPKNMNR